MRLKVVLYPSDEAVAVSAPSLPGCWSQGATREEALENIAIAIRTSSPMSPPRGGGSRDRDHYGLAMPKLPDINHLDAVRRPSKGGLPGIEAREADHHDRRDPQSGAAEARPGVARWKLVVGSEWRKSRPARNFGRAVTMFDFRCDFSITRARDSLRLSFRTGYRRC